jgi:hypothetical protein
MKNFLIFTLISSKMKRLQLSTLAMLLLVALLASCTGSQTLAERSGKREFVSWKKEGKRMDNEKNSKVKDASKNRHIWNKNLQ